MAALPEVGMQCSQQQLGSEYGQRRASEVLAVAGHDRARPSSAGRPIQDRILVVREARIEGRSQNLAVDAGDRKYF